MATYTFNESRTQSTQQAKIDLLPAGTTGPFAGNVSSTNNFKYPQNLGQPPVDKWILFEARLGRHVLRNQVIGETAGNVDRTLASVGLYLSETALKSTLEMDWKSQDLTMWAEMAAQAGQDLAVAAVKPGNASLKNFVGDLLQELSAAGSAAFNSVVNSPRSTAQEALGAFLSSEVSNLLDNPNMESLAGGKPNPRTDLLFNTQHYRVHHLGFTLIPRNLTEAQSIDNIIHMFQFYMLPKYAGNPQLATVQIGSFLIGFPYEFEITMFDGQANELLHLNRIGRSVLVSMTVDHAAGGKTAFVKQNGEYYPVASRIELEFQEVKLLARDSAEINRGAGSTINQQTLDDPRAL